MVPSEIIELNVPIDKQIYFASDFHLGSPTYEKSRERERTIIAWLDSIKADAFAVFLVGDVFDYWFEYKYVVPKGAVRLIGKLTELIDQGIEVFYFTGNHDMWMRDYFEKEVGVRMKRKPVRFEITQGQTNTSLFVVHGDGYGPGDTTYKLLKILFESSIARFFFRQVHPDLASYIAHTWSGSSRAANDKKEEYYFKGEDKEWLYLFCKEVEAKQHHDYYVFGHRHLEINLPVSETSRYINLGEWFTPESKHPFGVLNSGMLYLTHYRKS